MKLDLERRIPVGICETQPLLIEGLRGALSASRTFELLEPARSLEEALRQTLGLCPRVMILDKAFGTTALSEWIARTRGRTATSIVVWGAMVSEAEALRLLKAGAKGILRKTAAVDSVFACLESVVGGSTWMEEALFREASSGTGANAGLTTREQQVLSLVEQGLRNKEIAAQLGIRPGTVKIHLKHISEKTGIRGRYGLAISGLRSRELALAS